MLKTLKRKIISNIIYELYKKLFISINPKKGQKMSLKNHGIIKKWLNKNDPLVQFKLSILKKAFPAKDAIVFGDMYIVEGGYTQKCIEYGCEKVLLIDTLETYRWLDLRKKHPNINFYKGDFSNSLFMKSIQEKYDIAVVFDILLHQAPLLNTIHLMLEKVSNKMCIVQPMLQEQDFPNTLIYLPGNTAKDDLYPLKSSSDQYKMFNAMKVNHSNWIWGMTPSFLISVLKGEGFEVLYQKVFDFLPNKMWFWWGCVIERKYENPDHWSHHRVTEKLRKPT